MPIERHAEPAVARRSSGAGLKRRPPVKVGPDSLRFRTPELGKIRTGFDFRAAADAPMQRRPVPAIASNITKTMILNRRSEVHPRHGEPAGLGAKRVGSVALFGRVAGGEGQAANTLGRKSGRSRPGPLQSDRRPVGQAEQRTAESAGSPASVKSLKFSRPMWPMLSKGLDYRDAPASSTFRKA